MSNKRKSFGENTNIVLFNEVDGLCPLCGKPLVYEKNGAKYKKYEIAHIYPLNPKKEEKILLKNVEHLGSDVNDEENLIALCKDCHGAFDKPRTVREYEELVKIKKALIAKIAQQGIWYEFKIENEINKIINSLCTDDCDIKNSNLNYDPKEIENKLNKTITSLTKRRIKNNASDYYTYIKSSFASLDYENPGVVEVIFQQVKLFYVSQAKNEKDQQSIYKNTVKWMRNKTNSQSDEAVDIVVSFFVQNCEVF